MNDSGMNIQVESLRALDLDAVLAEAARYAHSQPGKESVCSSAPLQDFDEIKQNLSIVRELKEASILDGPLDLHGLIPLQGLLESLENPGAVLEPEDLLAVRDLLALTARTFDWLDRLDPRFQTLKALQAPLEILGDLRAKIERSIDDNGQVRMDASPELAFIGDRLREARESIRKRLDGFVRDKNLMDVVQEDYVTLRNDRYVILMKPHFRGKLDGIVHDHSRSGSSVYVEPFDVVEANNKVAEYADQQRAAVRKLLRDLSDEVRRRKDEITANFEQLVWLDALQARALYALATSSVEPEFVEDGFRIMGGRHPLLLAASPSDVVPMDVIQDGDTKVVIISGANMGGKTVALKIAGLFPLMIRCSLQLPAMEGTKIQLFGRIMADIGDEQDLRERISTFAGHILRMKSIIESASAGDLVLIDELGAATDPEEGAAIGMALLDCLVEKGVRCVVTTHLSQLKAYAFAHDHAKNVSVEFHPVTHEPTFRLIYDIPGESHAIATAQRIGLPNAVLDRARQYADKFAGGSAKLLSDLRQKIIEYDELQQQLKNKQQQLDDELAEIRSRKNQVIESFRERCVTLIQDAEKQIADLQKSLKERLPKKGDNPREKLKQIAERLESELGIAIIRRKSKLAPGAIVRIPSLDKQGKVTEVSDAGVATVAVGKLKVKVKTSDLVESSSERTEKNTSKIQGTGVEIPSASPQWQVKVIGLRVDEAIPVVEKAINDAFLGGLSELTIIHGRGTGALKKAVREYASGHALVKGLHQGDHTQGGDAVTVLELASH
ncbi:MAG: endonuclease MutS2 [Desulfomonilaceae bacterium]